MEVNVEKEIRLFEAEYRFAQIVWEHEPVGSGELARLCQEQLGWKRTTTYTVLKKLCGRGIMRNENAVVTALVGREEIQRQEGKRMLNRLFDGSLPGFVAAFVGEQPLTRAEAEQLKALIDRCREEDAQ